MTQQEFDAQLRACQETISYIQASAFQLHASVGQTYDGTHPYSLHLQMVADSVMKYGHEVCQETSDMLPIIFGAYYHDSIEDARLTYNNVVRTASHFMTPDQAVMAAEIVYALTNDKGRTRAERAGENYYRGIRQTPYAPLVKLADRLANTTYSATHTNASNQHMLHVYRSEMPHFIESIHSDGSDPRTALPPDMVEALLKIVE